MTTVRLRRKLESETLHLPGLRGLIGKTVEITIVEQPATKSSSPLDVQRLPTHTSRTLTLTEMARELDEVSHASAHPSVPLRHKVDYTHG